MGYDKIGEHTGNVKEKKDTAECGAYGQQQAERPIRADRRFKNGEQIRNGHSLVDENGDQHGVQDRQSRGFCRRANAAVDAAVDAAENNDGGQKRPETVEQYTEKALFMELRTMCGNTDLVLTIFLAVIDTVDTKTDCDQNAGNDSGDK